MTTAFCWSLLAIFLKYALNFADSATIVWSRMAIAAILMFLYIGIKQKQALKVFTNIKLVSAVGGILLACNYFGYMKGIELTSATNAQVMIQLAPTSLFLISIFVFKESPNKRQWIGVAIAALGFALFFKDQIQSSLSQKVQFIEGNIWIAGAALTWALFAVAQKISAKVNLNQFNFGVYLVAALALAPLANFSVFSEINSVNFLVLLFLGANTVIAYGCLGLAFKYAPASQVSLIIVLNPLITITLLQILKSFEVSLAKTETISIIGVFGALAVVSGVGIAISKKSKAKQS